MAVIELSAKTDLQRVYPLVAEGVTHLNQKGDPRAPAFAPEIYRRVLDNETRFLYVMNPDTYEPWGWGTFMTFDDKVNRRISMCELLYIRKNAPKHALAEFIDSFEKASQVDGASATMFETTRRAWERRLTPNGYQLCGYTFAKEFV